MYLALTGNICVCSSSQRAFLWVWNVWTQLTCLHSGPAHGPGTQRSWRCALCSCLQSRSHQSRTPTRPHTESRSPLWAWAAPASPPRSSAEARDRKEERWRETHQVCNTDNMNNNINMLDFVLYMGLSWKAPSILHTCDITQQGWRITWNTLFAT